MLNDYADAIYDRYNYLVNKLSTYTLSSSSGIKKTKLFDLVLLGCGIIACLAMIAITLSCFCPHCCLEAPSKCHAHILMVLQLGCRTVN